MKKLLYFVTFLGALILFTACSKDQDIYRPKQKLYKIWELSEVGDPDQTFIYDKKDRIEKIDVFDRQDSVHYYFNFTYNSDKTVATIEHSTPLYVENVKLYYVDKLVNRITYVMDGATRMEVVFQRDEKTTKITQVAEHYDVDYFSGFDKIVNAPLYQRIIGENPMVTTLYKENGTKGLILHCLRKVTYRGDNIINITDQFPEFSTRVTYDYTYDTLSFNPYYGLPYAYNNLMGYSKNNRASEYVVNYLNEYNMGSQFTTFEYILDKYKFPRRAIRRSSLDNIPFNTYYLYQLK